jgi:hypothetical protein
VYESETWLMAENNVIRLNTYERGIFRRIRRRNMAVGGKGGQTPPPIFFYLKIFLFGF